MDDDFEESLKDLSPALQEVWDLIKSGNAPDPDAVILVKHPDHEGTFSARYHVPPGTSTEEVVEIMARHRDYLAERGFTPVAEDVVGEA